MILPAQDGSETPLIDGIRHSSTVRHLPGDVDESIPGNPVILAKQLQIQQSALTVALVEAIRNVPSQRAKLLALLQCICNT